MDEVRSYWQVAGIAHFCNLFGKTFRLPQFEPEELEQAFILDVPEPPKNNTNSFSITSNNINNSSNNPSNNSNNINNSNNQAETSLKNNISTNCNNIDASNGDHNNHNDDNANDDDRRSLNNSTPNSLTSNNTTNQNEKKQQPSITDEDVSDDVRIKKHDPDFDEDTSTQTSSQCHLPQPQDRPQFDDDQGSVNNLDSTSSSSTPIPSTLSRQQTLMQNQRNAQLQQQQQQQQQQAEEQQSQNMHLLIKLGIALLKPHFNSKISQSNWENYLRRIVDTNWVELEHHPSPFQVPIISQDGVELTKNLAFNELPLSDKIDLFYALCDYRFWCEDASDLIKDYTLEELRLENIGKDSQGYEYWYFFGTRLFREDKELTNDIIMRKKRIKELEYNLIEHQKNRITREKEERRKAELEKARQIANEAREARLAQKRQQEQEVQRAKRRKHIIPDLPPRTGLRERRSSAAANTDSQKQNATPPTTRGRVTRLQQQEASQSSGQQSAQKATRNARNSKGGQNNKPSNNTTPDLPKKCPEEECKEELDRLQITSEHRANAWRLECESLEEWENFATRFEKTKSTNEKYLHNYINAEILPKIRLIYAKRAAEARRKEKELLYSLATRRSSTRILTRKAQEEEEERLAQEREAEIRRKKVEAEKRLRVELEREMRSRRDRPPPITNGRPNSTCSDEVAEEANTGPYNLRHQPAAQQVNRSPNDFDGIIHPDELSEFYEALELIVDSVRTSKHAWPFVDPVPDTVPGYYDLIEEPMDLKKLRTKVEFREYKSLIELEKDFQLLVNNCEKFNGPKNVYTKMVYKLWRSFRKNVRLYLQRDLTMNEYETFLYPPPIPVAAEAATESTAVDEPKPAQVQDELNVRSETCVVEGEYAVKETVSSDLRIPNEDNHSSSSAAQDSKPAAFEVEPKILGESIIPVKSTNGTSGDLDFRDGVKLELPQHKDSQIEQAIYTPEVISEEIIIDSYDVPCPEDNVIIVWPDGQPEQ